MTRKVVVAKATKAAAPRSFRFRISDGAEDRVRDRISPQGWRLDNYRRAPVVLWAHDHSIPAIAKCTAIGVEGTGTMAALMATAEFPPPGIHPLADQIHDLIAAGFIGSASVGFSPIRSETNELGGTDFLEQELNEWSPVNVGALPSALLVGRSANAAAVQKWLGGDDERVVLTLRPDDTVEEALNVSGLFDADCIATIRMRARWRDLFGDPHQRGHHVAGEYEVDPGTLRAAIADALPDILKQYTREAVPALVRAALARRAGRVD